MRQTYRQDSHSEDVAFLNDKIQVKGLSVSKSYCPGISQMYSSATTYNGSKYSSDEAKPQSCIHAQVYVETRNQYSKLEAQQGCAAVQESPARLSLLPNYVSGLNVSGLTSNCNMLGCHESSLQQSQQAAHAEGGKYANQQLLSSGTSQKQWMTALEFSEHVTFPDTSFYNNDYNNHIPDSLRTITNNAEFQWKHDCSVIHSGSMHVREKDTKNLLQHNDVLKNSFYIEDALERVEDSNFAVCLSSKRYACAAGKRRKRINTPKQRTAANIRERRRMNHLNAAFDHLKAHVPHVENKNKLSRIETLKAAIVYINVLRDCLGLC